MLVDLGFGWEQKLSDLPGRKNYAIIRFNM
jgi:hypothetical protein